MSLRVRQVLDDAGVGLGDLVRECGRSKTTWSLALNGGRELSDDDKAKVERVLRAKGVAITPELWQSDVSKRRRAGARSNKKTFGELNMQAQALSSQALKHWHLFMNPFDPEALVDLSSPTGDRIGDLYMSVGHQFVAARLIQALVKAGFVALAGEPGSGKTTMLERAFRDANEIKKLIKVTPANIERRKLTAAHIAAEIIRQLSEETVPQLANKRDALAAEILRQRYEEGQRVALVIDEAHELPHDTIKDLKRYHELTHGFAKLLAIVLIGQTELAARFDLGNLRLREVIMRCQLIQLPPMTGQVAGYLEKRFSWVGADVNGVFKPNAVQAMEARLGLHRQQYPVLIGNVAVAAMNIAVRRGNDHVTVDDVEDVWALASDQLQNMGL